MTAERWLREVQEDAERTLSCSNADCCCYDERARGREDVLAVVRNVMPRTEADYIESGVTEALTGPDFELRRVPAPSRPSRPALQQHRKVS